MRCQIELFIYYLLRSLSMIFLNEIYAKVSFRVFAAVDKNEIIWTEVLRSFNSCILWSKLFNKENPCSVATKIILEVEYFRFAISYDIPLSFYHIYPRLPAGQVSKTINQHINFVFALLLRVDINLIHKLIFISY